MESHLALTLLVISLMAPGGAFVARTQASLRTGAILRRGGPPRRTGHLRCGVEHRHCPERTDLDSHPYGTNVLHRGRARRLESRSAGPIVG
jgi:hypothetical protein